MNNRITHLYRRMGIKGEEFFPDEGSALDDAEVLFTAVYLVIGIVGVLCAVGVMLAP